MRFGCLLVGWDRDGTGLGDEVEGMGNYGGGMAAGCHGVLVMGDEDGVCKFSLKEEEGIDENVSSN